MTIARRTIWMILIFYATIPTHTKMTTRKYNHVTIVSVTYRTYSRYYSIFWLGNCNNSSVLRIFASI